MVSGKYFSFEFKSLQLCGTQWIVLAISTPEGQVFGCRWEIDANEFQIGAALGILSEALKSSKVTPNITPSDVKD